LESELDEVQAEVDVSTNASEVEAKVKSLESQLQEAEHQWKRALADYKNLMRQTQQERQEYVRFANSTLIAQWLPALDSLAMAVQHLKDPGLEMVYKQFQNSLSDAGVEEINPKEGEAFDAHLHEALDTIVAAE